MKPKRATMALALGAMFFAVLMPPEAYPVGRMAVILCATFAFLTAVIEKRVSRAYLISAVPIFSVLLVHSLWLSVDPYRSLEFLTVLWAYYCLVGFFMGVGLYALPSVAFTTVILSLIVSGYGIYQYFWGFDEMSEYLASSISSQHMNALALERIASGRIFSTFALPGTLWGFLVIALPIHAVLYRRNRILDTTLMISAAMLLMAGFLTRSFGFLIGLCVLASAALIIHRGKAVAKKAAVLLLTLIVAGGVFYASRPDAISSANPVSLRFKNWVSAWNIFAVTPLGTGLNTYGVVYPSYMLPGGGETQQAHNTPLQLMSELGYPGLLGAVALLLLLVDRPVERPVERRRGSIHEKLHPYVLLAVIGWCLHNLIDINMYFPSIGVIGAVFLGILFGKSDSVEVQVSPVLRAAMGIMAVAAISFSALTVVAGELQHRAKIEYDNGQPLIAVETLKQAQAILPINSRLFQDEGQILLDLYQKTRDRDHLTEAVHSLRQAIVLSPVQADHHTWLGLCLASSDDMDGAMKEIRMAESLYPESKYVQSIITLMEARIARTGVSTF